MSGREELLALLADGRFHSGNEIAKSLGLSPATVRKKISALSQLGVHIRAVSGHGYRLGGVFRPLNRHRILACLGGDATAMARRLYILDEVDSTNRWLLKRAAEGELQPGTVCVAEAQHAGRGQRGQAWIATPYANVMMSMAWQVTKPSAALTGLSLAAGVAVVQALQDHDVPGLTLKWPNDLMWEERKLGGLLVELHGRGVNTLVVIGVGVNVYVAAQQARQIQQPCVALRTIIGNGVDRDQLVARLIVRLREMYRLFEQSGFQHFRRRWERLHGYQGEKAVLLGDREVTRGRILGVTDDGALCVRDEQGMVRTFSCGEVSMRPRR